MALPFCIVLMSILELSHGQVMCTKGDLLSENSHADVGVISLLQLGTEVKTVEKSYDEAAGVVVHYNNSTSESTSLFGLPTCGKQEAAADAFAELFHDHRLAVCFGVLTALNIIWAMAYQSIRNEPFAEHLSHKHYEQTAGRVAKVMLCPALLLGYVVQIYVWQSGCRIAHVWVLTTASWTAFADLWEWVRRWPMDLDMGAHHFGVLTSSVLIMEEGQIKQFGAVLVLFLSSIGFQWYTDWRMNAMFFLTDIQAIKHSRFWQLCSGFTRQPNMFLLCWMCHDLYLREAWVYLPLAAALAAGYSWGNYRLLKWTYEFSPEKFYDTHQHMWLKQLQQQQQQHQTQHMSK